MEKKMTKVQMFEAIKEVEAVKANADYVAFIDHEIELLKKKATNKKATKNQVENEGYKATILEILANNPDGLTATEVWASSGLTQITSQRVVSLLSKMVGDGTVVRTQEGRKRPVFSIPVTED